MKIKIQQTIELSESDEKALRLYFEETRLEGETFRSWFKLLFISCGDDFFHDKICTYGRYVK